MAVKIFFIAVIFGVQQTCSAQYERSGQNCGIMELHKANVVFDLFERYIETETDLQFDNDTTASPKFESYLKTCHKAPSLLRRFKKLTDDVFVSACLKSRRTKYDGLKQQLQFVCELESKTVKEFIQNGGAGCVEGKKWTLLHYCDNTTHSPPSIFGETECELSEFQTCMVRALNFCSPPASRLLNSMYKQALMTCNRATPIADETELLASFHGHASAAPLNNGLAAISATVVAIIVAAASFC